MRAALRRDCLRLLRETFGMDGFRPGQEEAVSRLLAGRDTLCLFPTGAGKSLCYQLPALLLGRPTLVVSPLIALMRDQVASLARRGIPAVCLDSLLSPAERTEALRLIRSGGARLIYVSPERLGVPSFAEDMRRVRPAMAVVDEAHCVAKWGGGFRPAYHEIGRFLDSLPERPVVCAMTATADGRMRREIARSVGLRRPKTVILPLLRENLVTSVVTTSAPDAAILSLLREHAGEKALVFCRTRLRTEQLAARLGAAGLRAGHYHAGLEREDRMRIQEDFAAGRLDVLAATSAFGMGVDLPDIRLVVHDALPEDMIDYVQQAGRAGRDGARADCVLLFDPGDLELRRRALRSERKRAGLNPLLFLRWRRSARDTARLMRFCLDGRCPRVHMAEAFGQRAAPCGECPACRRAQALGGTRPAAPVPDLAHMDAPELRLWALTWQRAALAAREGKAPVAVLADAALRDAARTGHLPAGAADGEAAAALSRLLRRMG